MKKSLLIGCLAAVAFVAPVANAEDIVLDGVTYTLNEELGGLEIKSTTITSGDIVIPSSVKVGSVIYDVVAVGKNAFQYCEANSVTLPNSVIELKNNAFAACDCKRIDLGQGLEVIGSNPFGFSRDLEWVSELPASLKTIPALESIFTGNYALKEIKVNSANPYFKDVDGVLYNKNGNVLVSYPFGRGLEYVIPEGVDTIVADAFTTFQTFEKVTFPSTLKYIGRGAFTYCSAMVNTNDLPEGLEVVGANAFSNCRKINVSMPSTLTLIAMTAFNNNYAMTGTIHIPAGVKTVGQQSFAAARLVTGIVIDEGVEVISSYAFQNITKVTEVVIPNSVTKLDSRCFAGCSGLKRIEIGEGVTSLGVAPFEYTNPEIIICHAVNPPAYGNYPTYTIVANIETVPLYVPDASVEAYKTAQGWDKCKNIKPLSELGSSAIADLEADAEPVAVTYYNVQGVQVAPEAGDNQLYIVVKKYADGSVKTSKVINR